MHCSDNNLDKFSSDFDIECDFRYTLRRLGFNRRFYRRDLRFNVQFKCEYLVTTTKHSLPEFISGFSN